MPLPRSKEARDFYQAANRRFEDGQFLLDAGRNTGAVYLAGYAVECMLKALILSSVPGRTATGVLARFRGARAHDYVWLREQYSRLCGPGLPVEIVRDFAMVSTWGTQI